MSPLPSHRRRGMTLIEVMVALSVLVLMGAITFASIASAVEARNILERNDAVQQSARVAMARLSRELQLAWLTPNLGTIASFRTVFVAKDSEPVDQLWFATLAHKRLYANARESDQAEVTVWGEPDPDRPGTYILLHRESPRIDEEPDEDGAVHPLAYGVRAFRVRYLDHTTCEWSDEWDSTSVEQTERLPRAAQIMLVIEGPDPEDPEQTIENTFATTVLLEYSKRATCQLFTTDEAAEQAASTTGSN